MVNLAGTTDAELECLRGPGVPLQGVRVKQVAALLREDQTALVVAKVDGLDEPLVAEMVDGAPVDIEILFGHDSERADGGQRTTLLAVQP